MWGHLPLRGGHVVHFLWRPFDANAFSLIYAGAQRNSRCGVTIVVVKKSWIETANKNIRASAEGARPHSSKDSLYNTPPTFSVAWCATFSSG